MSTKYTIHESRRPLELDADTYDAVVSKAEEVDGKFGTQVQLTFIVPEYPEEVPVAWASAGGGTATKFFKWCTALLGGPPPIGSEIGPDDLVGKKCRIVVDEKETSDGRVVMAVTGILKPKAPKAAASVAVKQKPLEPAPTPVATPGGELADACYCGAPAFTYTEDGAARCEEHAATPEEIEAAGQGALVL